MILITGASGKTGMAILSALRQKRLAAPSADLQIRGMVRRSEQVALLESNGATEAFVGDIRQEEDWAAALKDVETVYHICPNMQPDEVAIGQLLIRSAQRAGVERIVYHSVLHPQTEEMPHHWHKLRVEELLFQSGLEYTILQPAAYMQNVLAGWQGIVDEGLYRVPYAVSTVLGMVELADVAEAAAEVLLGTTHDGAIYELATDERLTQSACAAIMGEVLNRSVKAIEIDLADWHLNAVDAGLSPFAIETLLKMFAYYEQYGFFGNATVLTTLLGRSPTTFRDFVEKVAMKV